MIEVVNKGRSPVQLVVRSRKRTRSFSTLNVPGLGNGKNTVYLKDEQMTDYVERLEKEFGLITTKHIPDNEFQSKGE